jgi:hypothetical protein
VSSKKKGLTPPDLKQCQAEKPNGHTFMTLGGKPGMVRCDRKPTVILTENKPGADGQKGSMSLCDGCLAQFRKQMPRNFATVRDIEGWEEVHCDLCPKPIAYQHPHGGKRCKTCPRPDA